MIIKFLRSRKYLLTFLSVIFLISLISGIILYFKCSNDTKLSILNSISNLKEDLLNNHINNIFLHLIIILSIILLSFTILGYFSAIFYLFYEGISISFTLCFLIKYYGLNGLIFGILYNILFKLLFLLIYILIIIKLLDLIKNIILYFYNKRKTNNFKNIKRIIQSILILIVFLFINDLILYLIANFILKILLNVL